MVIVINCTVSQCTKHLPALYSKPNPQNHIQSPYRDKKTRHFITLYVVTKMNASIMIVKCPKTCPSDGSEAEGTCTV